MIQKEFRLDRNGRKKHVEIDEITYVFGVFQQRCF